MNNNKNQYRQEDKEEIGKTSDVSTKDEKITTVMKRKQKNKWENARKLGCDDDVHRGWNDAHFHSRLCVKYLELLKISLKVCFIKVGGKLSHHYFHYKDICLHFRDSRTLIICAHSLRQFICLQHTNKFRSENLWVKLLYAQFKHRFVCMHFMHTPIAPYYTASKTESCIFFLRGRSVESYIWSS